MTWMDLLINAVNASSKAKVAETIGVSRTTVSLIVNNKYPASTEHVAQMVLSVYGHITCPHFGAKIPHHECQDYQNRQSPTGSPREMRHWRACQECHHNETLALSQGEQS